MNKEQCEQVKDLLRRKGLTISAAASELGYIPLGVVGCAERSDGSKYEPDV